MKNKILNAYKNKKLIGIYTDSINPIHFLLDIYCMLMNYHTSYMKFHHMENLMGILVI